MNSGDAQLRRRDWFRLLRPKSESPREVDADVRETPSESSAIPTLPTGKLQPIPLPPNHDSMDLDQLPPLREALIVASELLQLELDILENATQIQLGIRQNSNARTQVDSNSAVRAAFESFRAGRVARLQVRYVWNSSLWIDTLESKPNGIRLVRIQHSDHYAL